MSSAPSRSEAGAPAIRVSGVSKSFRGTVALSDVSFELARGEILGLLGPSGCGKTTTLRVLAGFERPDAGVVQISGASVVGGERWLPPEHRRIGVVPQDFALFPHLCVAENVAFGLPGGHRAWWRARWSRALKRTRPPSPRVLEMLNLVGLSGFAERFPHELSGGEAQRVALARALAPRPAAVLLDEPFSNLDQHLRASLRWTMRRILKAANTAAVFVTHDREEALSLADRVAVMQQGRIEQIGSPDDVYYRPRTRFIGSFVGDANVLRGRLSHSGAETELGFVMLRDESRGGDGAAVDVLLRPEQLELKRCEASDPEYTRVVSSEYYGHDQIVRVRLTSGTEIEARLRTDIVWLPGDPVDVVVLDEGVAFPLTE